MTGEGFAGGTLGWVDGGLSLATGPIIRTHARTKDGESQDLHTRMSSDPNPRLPLSVDSFLNPAGCSARLLSLPVATSAPTTKCLRGPLPRISPPTEVNAVCTSHFSHEITRRFHSPRGSLVRARWVQCASAPRGRHMFFGMASCRGQGCASVQCFCDRRATALYRTVYTKTPIAS